MMDTMVKKMEELRRRARRHPRLSYGLLLGFVPFVVLLMEWGHLQSLERVAEFVIRSPGVFLFGWIAALVGTVGVPEALVAAVLSTAICRPLLALQGRGGPVQRR